MASPGRGAIERSPKFASPSCVAAGFITRKYRRLRSRPSPLSEHARLRLLSKLNPLADSSDGGSCQVEPVSEVACQVEPTVLPTSKELLRQVLVDKYHDLSFQDVFENGDEWTIVFRLSTHPLVGPIQNPRLCVHHGAKSASNFRWQVYYDTVQDGAYDTPADVEVYLRQLHPSSGFVVCPGIREYPDAIRFSTKNLKRWGPPFNRMFSSKCVQWHVPNNVQQSPSSVAYDCCKPCKQLLHDIKQLEKRSEAVSDTQRVIRTLPSSNYPLSKLSPVSQKARIANMTMERNSLVRQLKRLTPFECDVSDKQHSELLQMVALIHKKGTKVIDQLIEEGKHFLGEDSVLKDSWRQDVVERLQYEEDQHRSVTKSHGNRWNQVTVRMALAVYSRSPASYEALRSFKLVQLPSVRTLKYYVDANLKSAGDSHSRILQSRKQYIEMLEEKAKQSIENSSNPEKTCLPLSEGVLIMDEVKVGMKLLWSSRNQKFIGHSMTHDELASMSDVYSVLSPDYRKRQTTYVLQVLWRDLTSEFDIIGPHYTSDSQFPHQALCRLLIDSIHQFHVCGFETVAVVCDGAAPNMTMVKEMSGAARKAYSLNTGSAAIDPSFVSPYTGRSVHFIICPSHQLKNMVSALFQSRPVERGGTRNFTIGSSTFGWSAIEDLYARELSRIRAGQCSRVPKLKQSHIRRDSWTRLNVLPSKVMQQDEVISELKEYVDNVPIPEDAESVKLVIAYLQALNNIFEKSILGKRVRVFSAEGTTMKRIDEGFQFFDTWAKEIEDNDEDKRSFLSWQTWDLLRIMCFGFKNLVKDFTATHPGYSVNPKRVNGSAVETLFSELKHTTGGNLTAANYESAKATLLTKRECKGQDSYRSDVLYLRQSELARKSKST